MENDDEMPPVPKEPGTTDTELTTLRRLVDEAVEIADRLSLHAIAADLTQAYEKIREIEP